MWHPTSLSIRLTTTINEGESGAPAQSFPEQTTQIADSANMNNTTATQTSISQSATNLAEQTLVVTQTPSPNLIILGSDTSQALRRFSSSSLLPARESIKIDYGASGDMTLASLPGLASTQPFRFRDLPAELRVKIFRLLLSNFKRIPKLSKERQLAGERLRLQYMSHQNEYNILQVSRAIYDEAKYAMRKANLFVKVIVNVSPSSLMESIETCLIAVRLPVMWLCTCHAANFSDAVLTHEISSIDPEKPMKQMIFVFLGRDMVRFVEAMETFSFVPAIALSIMLC